MSVYFIRKAGVVLSSVFLLGVLSGCIQESSDSHIENGQDYFENGKINAALIEFKNAVKASPDVPKYRNVLGRFYLSLGQYSNANKELGRAWKQGFRSERFIDALLRSHWHVGNSQEIVDSYNELAYELRTPAAKAYLGMAYLDKMDFSLAEATVKSIPKESPYYTMLQGRILLLKGEFEQADQILQVDGDEKTTDLLYFKGLAAFKLGRFENALHNLGLFVERQPFALHVFLPIMQAELALGKLVEAEEHAKKILKGRPNHPIANMTLARVLYSKSEFVPALTHAERAIQNGESNESTRFFAALTAYKAEAYESAYRHLNSIEKTLVEGHPAKQLQLMLEKKLGYDKHLISLVEGIENWQEKDVNLVTQLSEQFARESKLTEAERLLSILMQSVPDNSEVLLRSGYLNLSLNPDLGIQQLEKAAQMDDSGVEPSLLLALTELSRGKTERPLRIANSLISQNPESVAGYVLLAMAKRASGELDQASSIYAKVLEMQPDNKGLHMNKVAVEIESNKQKQALETINSALIHFPYDPEFLRLRNTLVPQEAIQSTQEAINAHPDEPVYRVMLSSLRYVEGNIQAAVSELSDFAEDNAEVKIPGFFWQSLYLLYIKSGEDESAEKTIQKWITASNRSLNSILFLVQHYYSLGKPDAVAKLLDAEIGSRNGVLLLRLKRIQHNINYGNIRDAEEEFRLVRGELGNKLIARSLMGQLYLAKNRHADAIKPLKELYDKKPTLRNSLLLGSALSGSGRTDEAIEYYDQLLSQSSKQTIYMLRLAELLIDRDSPKAISLYQNLLKEDPDDLIALNNLSFLYSKAQDYSAALEYAQRAVAVAPNNPSVLHTLAKGMLSAGKQSESLEVFEKAYDITDGKNSKISLGYAQLLIDLGKHKDARMVIDRIEPSSTEELIKSEELRKQL